MSDTMEVRDHSQPCEHGMLLWHHQTGQVACPGGKRVVLKRSSMGPVIRVEGEPAASLWWVVPNE